ncbi:unnamed protein product, partial [Cyprideis torosa]
MLDPTILLELKTAIMPYGKYKNRKLIEIPTYYLEWHYSKGFPKGKLGMQLHTLYEIRINGLDELLEGYVGLPLAVEFSKKYSVLGFDISIPRVNELNKGIDSTLEISEPDLKNALQKGLKISSNTEDLKDYNIYIVTVPTPVDDSKKPDLMPLLKASEMLGKVIKKNDIVIYESTTYPGCTEEDCVPILEKESGLEYNKDFYVGYSPERINPGDKVNTLTKIKKVTSGSTPEIATLVDNLYGSIIEAGTFKASSIKVAEASKAIENAQRDVNISFVNELAIIFEKLDIDTNDVLAAAGTKWNFLNFKPGLVGGHCISVDPYYLAYKSEKKGYLPNVILSGRRVNDYMGQFIANKVIKLLINKGNTIKDAKVLILGFTFKENCPDIRNTKIIDIYHELIDFG